jgi:hypothetical protein
MVKKDMKKWSTSLPLKEIQTQTIRRFYLTTVGMAINKKANNKCWQECRRKEPLYIFGGNVN